MILAKRVVWLGKMDTFIEVVEDGLEVDCKLPLSILRNTKFEVMNFMVFFKDLQIIVSGRSLHRPVGVTASPKFSLYIILDVVYQSDCDCSSEKGMP